MTIVVAKGLALAGRLQPTDLTLAAGTLTCLVGPNGSGKTSLLHALARIGGAGGTVQIEGEDVGRVPPARRIRLLAFLPATRHLGWPIAARDVVALSGARHAEVEAALDRLDLQPFTARRADHLSTGERSRVLIARALAPMPRLLLLDEPTANLDPLWQIRLVDLLQAEVAGSGCAALVAMHDLDAAARRADRLLIMEGGRIAADGAPSELLNGPVVPAVFGIERGPDGWREALSPAEGLRPLP